MQWKDTEADLAQRFLHGQTNGTHGECDPYAGLLTQMGCFEEEKCFNKSG